MCFRKTKKILIVFVNTIIWILCCCEICGTAGRAYANDYTSLPGGNLSQRLLDGTQVNLTLSREHVKLTPSVVAVWASHMALVSGVYNLKLSNSAKAKLQAGYQIGCSLLWSNSTFQSTHLASLGLGSGTWKYDLTKPLSSSNPQINDEPGPYIDFGDYQFIWQGTPGTTWFTPFINNIQIANNGGYAYDNAMQVQDSCAGYAVARAKAILTVTTTGNETASLTMWGKPFNLSS